MRRAAAVHPAGAAAARPAAASLLLNPLAAYSPACGRRAGAPPHLHQPSRNTSACKEPPAGPRRLSRIRSKWPCSGLSLKRRAAAAEHSAQTAIVSGCPTPCPPGYCAATAGAPCSRPTLPWCSPPAPVRPGPAPGNGGVDRFGERVQPPRVRAGHADPSARYRCGDEVPVGRASDQSGRGELLGADLWADILMPHA